MQDLGKAYNESKQGEPAIERLFDLTSLESKVLHPIFSLIFSSVYTPNDLVLFLCLSQNLMQSASGPVLKIR